MRVKLGHRIYLCTVATHRDDSNLILLTTTNGIYTVDMERNITARIAFNDLLEKGYCDFSYYEYSN